MTRIVLSSAGLPEGLSENERFSQFQELFSEKISTVEMRAPADIPFWVESAFTILDDLVVAHAMGTIQGGSRTSQHIATETGEGAYNLNFNADSTLWSFAQRGRELVAPKGTPVFTDCFEKIEVQATGENAVVTLRLPRGPLLELIPNLDDHVLRPLDPTCESVRHLGKYLQFLNDPASAVSDPAMIAHIRATLLDLVALALGANRDAADLAQARGLRAARLREIVAQIQNGFWDQSFSAHHVAQRMKVTPGYVQNILQETGLGFVERVTELRLQKVRQMLESQQYDHLKVAEIALRCGFNDISYFHRIFRRRFGESPGQYRRQDSKPALGRSPRVARRDVH